MYGRLWLAGVWIVAPHVAFAQDATPASALPANVSVADRGRPDYDPIGGRVGSFFLYPRLNVSAQYTSNLRAAEQDPISDVLLDVRPSARLTSVWSRHSLEANVFYQQTVHARYARENVTSYGADTTGRYDFGRGSARLTLGAAQFAEPRSAINSNLASREPITFINLNAAGTVLQQFNRISLQANAGVVRQKFDDGIAFDGTPLPQGFRDNTNWSVGGEAGLLIGAGTRAIVRAQTGAIRYDTNPFSGFDRNSRSYRLEGGVALNISTLLSGSATVGYFRQNNDDARFVDSSGISFSVDLLYNPTALTSVRLVADRSVEPGGSTITSGNVRSAVGLIVDHELRPNLVVSADGRYAHIDPQGALDSADEYSVGASALYYFNRRFRFSARVGYSGRQSNFFPEYNAVTGSLGVVVTL